MALLVDTMKKLLLLGLLILQCVTGNLAWAQQSFVVRDIRIVGIEHLTPATVESYMPIKRGQTLYPSQTAAIVRSLYKSGFFDRITLSHEGGTLIVQVVERPTIGLLKVTGNSVIPADKLTSVMKSLDVAQGSVYNPSVLERIRQSLLNQYYMLGRYNARVDIKTSPMPRNRISVAITISEGLVAKIKRITIIGNQVFSESTLVRQLDISTSGILSIVTQSDRYSEEKLDASMEKLRSYYLDHGYLRMQVKSAQAQVSPDRKAVYITFVISEDKPYTIASYDIQGNYVVSKDELKKLVHLTPGETFSRQKLLDSQKAITNYLGNLGYMYVNANLRPQIDDKDQTVNVVFDIDAGRRTYVRHVTFSDNTRTNDVVLRREIQQMEAAPAATGKLDESKQRLTLLPYIKDVEMSVKRVPEKSDQVDVDYKVKEDNSAQASLNVGYSPVYGAILGAGLNQKNFFGTGNTLGINLQRSKYEQFYGIDYTDPYYTEDGISRTFNFSISRLDPGAAENVSGSYTTNEYDLGVLYGIPIGQEAGAFNRLQVGASYQNTLVNLIPKNLSAQVNSFVNQNGRHFQELDMKVGLSRDSRDKAIFPTSGSFQTLFLDGYAPLAQDSLSFYTLNYSGKWYQPIVGEFILYSKANLGYGNGLHGINDFPFYKNYFVGGIDSVRGYLGYTLGPRDSTGKAYGGNMLVDGSLAVIFPNHLSDSLRTSAFVDAGNVYTSLNNREFGGQSTNPGYVRFSTGVEADVLTPFGPIELSLATPINRRHGHSNIPGDNKDLFQFALGANF